MYHCNIGANSRNRYGRGKAISITYSEHVSVYLPLLSSMQNT